jgi:hypothetical protein
MIDSKGHDFGCFGLVKSKTAVLGSARWRATGLALLVSLAVIIFFYWSTLGAMAPQWHSSTYSHGYVIFPASLYIIWKRRNTLGALTPTPSIWAILLLILATFGWLLGDLTTTAVVEQFCAIATIIGVAWGILGTAAMRPPLFPLAFLIFALPLGDGLNHLYLIVHAVEGLPPGAYVFHRSRGFLECLKQGNFRPDARYLGLGQELPADAAVDIFFLTDLRPILQRFGDRGYRAVQLEAGILGGKLYLAAYAQRLGATGLTFFDDDVTRFFSPHAGGKNAIFLTAVGHSANTNPDETQRDRSPTSLTCG